ncbi:MAG: LamG-like jellyroll fold domain-containing protein [Ignavibacteriaceae bacterium]
MKKSIIVLLVLLAGYCQGQDSYLVYGAGLSSANGIYAQNGTYNSKPVYTFGNYTLGYDTYDGWAIGEAQNGNPWFYYIYYSSYDYGDTPPASGWEVNSWNGGVAPAPLLTSSGSALSYTSTQFVESQNDDGTISNSITIRILSTNNDAFTGNNGDDFLLGSKATLSNVPGELTASITRRNSSTIKITLSGSASSHTNANDASNLLLTFLNSAFVGNNSANVSGSEKTLSVEFIQIHTVGASGADFTTIASAIAGADDYDILSLAGETFTESGISVNKTLTIKGTNASNTIIQGHSTANTASNRVFTVSSGLIYAKFYNLTIQHGYLNSLSDPKGGGIYSESPTELYYCRLLNNKVYNPSTNLGSAGGGGAYFYLGPALFDGCEISGNTAYGPYGRGGGVYISNGVLTLKNSTIYGNAAVRYNMESHGGGIVNSGTGNDVVNIINCTVTNNSANNGGGGLKFYGGVLNIKNSIIYNNTSGDIERYDGTTNAWNSIYGSGSNGSIVGTNSNNSNSDPLLSAIANNGGNTRTLALQNGSPAINAGIATDDIPILDQRGLYRDITPDIGGYEYNGSETPPAFSAPSTQAYSISFSDVTGSSMQINWSNGNGSKRLVFAKESSTGSATPVDNTTYTANSVFGDGTEIGSSGWFCVYSGTGSSVSLTGLTSDLTYIFHVIECNGTISLEKYLTTSVENNPRTQSATIQAPTTQAHSIVFSNIYGNSIQADWTNGNGSKRVVFVKQATSGTASPSNNTTYVANTSFSQGTEISGTGWYCVYNGAGSSVTVSGLSINTSYIFQIFEYNGTSGTEKYKTETTTDNPKTQSTNSTIYNFALSFNGSDNYVNCGSGNAFDISGESITIEAWINSSNINQNWQAIAGKQASGGAYYGLILDSDTKKPALYLHIDGWWGQRVIANTALSQDTWYHVAAVYDGSNAYIYINGVQDGSSACSGDITSGLSTPFHIAMNNNVYFNGKIDEVRLWNTARTQSELRDNMTSELVGNETGLAAYYKMSNGSGSSLSDNKTGGTSNGTINGASWVTIPSLPELYGAPGAQPTDLVFSSSKSGESSNILLSYTASSSAENYIIIGNAGSAPTFIPSDGTEYSPGAQTGGYVVYSGNNTNATDPNISTGRYYYKIYAFNGTEATTKYLKNNPLSGNVYFTTGTTVDITNTGSNPVSAGFPNAGVNVTFANGTTGTNLTATKTNSVPASNFAALPGVRGIKNLYFTITSDPTSAGTYTLILDFSSLPNMDGKWNSFKIMKRANSTEAWKDVTAAPINATIVNRQTDGVWGKFTISGLTSFSEFGGGEESVTHTVTSASNDINVAGSLRKLINSSEAGDVITFNTVDMGTNSITLADSAIYIYKDLTIRGVDGGIVLNGNNATMVLLVGTSINDPLSPVVRLEKLIIKGGNDTENRVGGIDNFGELTMVNCLVADNTDTGNSEGTGAVGGILSNGDLTLVNCTIAGNNGAAGDDGIGGIYCAGNFKIFNSILYGNTGEFTDIGGDITESGNSLYGDLNDFLVLDSKNDIAEGTNPRFIGSGDHPYLITGISPCADAGNDSYCFETKDLRGTDRKLDKDDASAGTIDIGAYEYKFGEDPLPVELKSFTASVSGKKVTLDWQTTTEVSNYGFEVERKSLSSQLPSASLSSHLSSEEWEQIGFVAGAGNSNSAKEYSFTDKDIKSGKYQYRLKQIDNDGTYSYSDVIEVEVALPTEFKLEQNYPNPFNPTTTIRFGLPVDSKVVLEIYNIIGEKIATLINSDMEAGYHNYQFSSTNYKLSSGIYFFTLSSAGFTQTKKMFLLK